MDINLEIVENLITLANENSLAELTVEHKDLKISLKTALGASPLQAPAMSMMGMAAYSETSVSQAPSVAEMPSAGSDFATSNHYKVTSPMVGTYYGAPSPDAPAFVKVGDRVSKGQTLCIIEAMKLMNELEAEVSGVVRKINTQNASPVEYGQVLMEIETQDA